MENSSSSSVSGSLSAPSVCEEDEGVMFRLNSSADSSSNLAAFNLSLNCWLHILSRESSLDLHGDSSNLPLRVLIALVYLVVCVLGLVGNLLALLLLHSRHRGHHSSIDCFVMSLALTDLQFVLTLPFWAVDTVMDFRWPFGRVMCKIVSSVTTLNMYASVFFLTAMSVTRYHTLVTSLRMESPRVATARAKWASLAIWMVSLVATLPHVIYSTTVQVSADDELCLVRFSESDSDQWDPQVLLGLYQMQKVLLGFLAPLIVISVCYLLLLRFILSKRVVGSTPSNAGDTSEYERGRQRRRSKVTRSVTIVVLSFFVCWLPNQALTLWGVLIKFDLVPFSKAFYNAQAYAFPLTVCLAHANSCLNPVLYCLIRKEYRAGLKALVLRVSQSLQNVLSLSLRGRKVEEAPPCVVMIHKDMDM
ncbi:relaxin-3 receptor 1-like [Takifugu rubripes]|uniref:Relaxin-3 receptor 1-like n=1 Tax=Takifugu rubripes TaxID=31033 RepID=A0A674PP22_TAKRU|nr:relaxin-3 receptor 1-like [Takifugu rubripes]|eukprot:XP_003975689.1 PREDICTED: relaxin-3 receptor 1-like [Takifugu rubripes]